MSGALTQQVSQHGGGVAQTRYHAADVHCEGDTHEDEVASE